jgi:hypothetical protein
MTQKEKWKKGVGKEDCVVASGAGNHRGRRRASNEAGQVLLLTALAMIVLIGFLALATDVGFFRYVKRNMQKAADAGAIGGATELIYNVGNIDFGAKRDTLLNGFTHNQEGVIVTVNNPPLSGPHKDLPNKDQYVEVIIEQDRPTFFARIFNINSKKVIARAVAHGGLDENTQADGCIFTLDPDGDPSFHVGGNNTSVEVDCGIVVNSDSDNCALLISGNSTVQADGISVVGKSCIEGSNTDVDPAPVEGPAASDPLSYLVAPTGYPTSCPPDHDNVNVQANTTLQPGVYCGGIRISSSGLTVNFAPGLYILHNGGFHVHPGGSTLTGSDVTFYNTGDTDYGAIVINANAETYLSATDHLATSGQGDVPFQSIPGVLFWQDENNDKEATFNGNSDTVMEGAFYLPGADVKFNGGNSTETGYALVVAQNVKFSGSATFHITNESSGSGGSGSSGPVARVVLVE